MLGVVFSISQFSAIERTVFNSFLLSVEDTGSLKINYKVGVVVIASSGSVVIANLAMLWTN